MGYEVDFLPVGDGEKSGDAISLRFGNLFGGRNEQVVIIIDGVNEHPDPVTAFGIINDFVVGVPEDLPVRVLLSSRPQVWHYARSQPQLSRYQSYRYFPILDAQ